MRLSKWAELLLYSFNTEFRWRGIKHTWKFTDDAPGPCCEGGVWKTLRMFCLCDPFIGDQQVWNSKFIICTYLYELNVTWSTLSSGWGSFSHLYLCLNVSISFLNARKAAFKSWLKSRSPRHQIDISFKYQEKSLMPKSDQNQILLNQPQTKMIK